MRKTLREVHVCAPTPRAQPSSPLRKASAPRRRFPIGAERATTRGNGFPVVAVGASAGGLEAFSQILENLPPKIDAAFVFVQHLSPQHESDLPELLVGADTAQGRDRPQTGCGSRPVTCTSCRRTCTWTSSTASCTCCRGRRTGRSSRPIDFFFQSLARWAQDRAIGVILSGTASDGAVGHPRDQGARRHHDRADAGDGEARRHAAGRDRHRHGRSGAVARARLPSSSARSAGIRICARSAASPPTPRVRRHRAAAICSVCCAARAASISSSTRCRPSGAGCCGAWRCCASRSSDAYLRHVTRDARRSEGARAGSADPRHAFLPGSGLVRGAGDARVSRARARATDDDADPHLGARLRHGRGGVQHRHEPARVAGRPHRGAPDPDLRDRRQRGGHRAGAHAASIRPRSRPMCRPSGCGASSRSRTAAIASSRRCATCACSRATI